MTNDPHEQNPAGKMFPYVSRAIKNSADLMLEKSGLHHGQARLLMILSHADGMSHSKIARDLHISPAAATKVIKRMEQQGYVQRRSDPTDERISRVYLKEEGLILVQKIHATFDRLESIMFRGFSDDELVVLETLLTRIYDNLQENILNDNK
ncbi:MAG TPA: MarR family transcriptional regulator [Anaerolineaceae bacterium]|nr:MarR family transcriptional regulator [Anaerolineaceae bacterium]